MIGATRLAAKTLLAKKEKISSELKDHLSRLITAEQTSDHFKELDALGILESAFKEKPLLIETVCIKSVQKLIETVWHYVFMHYFWLKKHVSADAQDKSVKEKKYN